MYGRLTLYVTLYVLVIIGSFGTFISFVLTGVLINRRINTSYIIYAILALVIGVWLIFLLEKAIKKEKTAGIKAIRNGVKLAHWHFSVAEWSAYLDHMNNPTYLSLSSTGEIIITHNTVLLNNKLFLTPAEIQHIHETSLISLNLIHIISFTLKLHNPNSSSYYYHTLRIPVPVNKREEAEYVMQVLGRIPAYSTTNLS